MTDEEQAAFESHLDDCRDCRRRLQASAADDDAWSEVREALHPQLPSDALKVRDAALDTAAGDDAPFNHNTVLNLLAPTDDPQMLGRLGAYEVVGIIGSGGMGVVLKAFDRALNRYVAIKVLAPHLGSSGAARRRFSREAQAAAAVVHDNVIEIHGVADTAGLPYLVMPYVRGPSLQRRLDDEGPLAVAEILRIGMQAAAGLAAAHGQGLVHRDVKPANILLAEGVERVKLTDFGLARAADDASLTKTGIIAGTPQYMSPEQARGESVDGRSDLFSLGSVLYALCTGRAPFRAETSYGVLRRITDDEPRPIREINPEIPQWLCRIVARLMAKRPEDRFGSAREVAELLKECLAHVQQPTAVPLPPRLAAPCEQPRAPQQPAPASRRRGPALKLLTAAGFVLAVIFAGIMIVLELNKGTLAIECNDDGIPVRIMQGDEVVEQLTVTRAGASIRIAAGRYVVEIDGGADGITVENGTVTLRRGKREVVKIVRRDDAQRPAPSPEHAASVNNLQRLLVALHKYHDVHKHFPPAVVLGKDGKGTVPHSWRVELLPFLDEQELYDQYRFDEPWNSKHNATLLPRMPSVFRSPREKTDSMSTAYFGVVAGGRAAAPRGGSARGRERRVDAARPRSQRPVRPGRLDVFLDLRRLPVCEHHRRHLVHRGRRRSKTRHSLDQAGGPSVRRRQAAPETGRLVRRGLACRLRRWQGPLPLSRQR